MINRIFNKLVFVLNTILLRVHEFLESKGFVKKITPEIVLKEEKKEFVQLKLPLNYKESNSNLFAHYNNYQTNTLIHYKFNKVNLSADGIIFKGCNNSWLNLPHVVFRAQYAWLYILKNKLFRKKVNATSETYVLLFDFWSAKNYYHWLIDALPRLLMILKEFNNSNYTLVLPKKASRFVGDTLRLYNVTKISFIENDSYLSKANLLMPDYAAGSGHIHPTFVNEVRRKLMELVAGTGKHERIYVSRSKQKARRIVNEAEVIEILKQHNFEIVYFENLSFEEQVLLVKNARYYVSSHGANMTNLMFMKDGAGVLELIREDSPNFCYWALSDVCKMNYYYQLCTIAEKDHLFVNLSELKENLKLLLNE